MMFMGTEGHLDGWWDWDPQDTSGDRRVDWSRMGDPTGAPMQRMVADVNALRFEHGALRSPAGAVIHQDRQGQVIAFKRYDDGGDIVVVVVNASDNQWAFHDYGVDMAGESGTWTEIFNSQAPIYGGFDAPGNYQEALEVREGKLLNQPTEVVARDVQKGVRDRVDTAPSTFRPSQSPACWSAPVLWGCGAARPWGSARWYCFPVIHLLDARTGSTLAYALVACREKQSLSCATERKSYLRHVLPSIPRWAPGSLRRMFP